MRILLINPPYQTFTCNLGVGHQTPLGLLLVGGALLDAGHDVQLLDAEATGLGMPQVVERVGAIGPDVVMVGHAGSTPAHPTCMAVLRAVKAQSPHVVTVYGGVYPTFHAGEVLEREPAVDIIVRGEGEEAAQELAAALGSDRDLRNVAGLAFRSHGETVLTAERAPIQDLNRFRPGWELVRDWDRYECFGLGRAAVVQFSRGCPHQCTFCGQRAFWKTWRHRDPVRFAGGVEWLHRERGVRFFHLADDNPTTDREVWLSVLEELARRELPVCFYTTIRASDIVRDRDALHLYRRAGVLYVLMGIESTDPAVLEQARKGETVQDDQLACRLLREHGIISVVGQLVGFGHERWRDFRHALRQLTAYDPDWVNVMHVTPHAWTEFGEEALRRGTIEHDLARWDYRHQVLAQDHMKPWEVFVAGKWLEARFHMRPRRLWRTIRTRDPLRRSQLLWSLRHTSPIWFAEIAEFLWDRLRPRRSRG